MNLKNTLKLLKNNESNVSMLFGVIVILIVGFFIIQNFGNKGNGEIVPSVGIEKEDDGSYVVKKGDDLWNIAENFYGDGFRWEEIAKVNDIKDPSLIEEGQKLTIPKLTVSPTQVSQTPTVEPTVEVTAIPTKASVAVIEPSPILSSSTDSIIKGDKYTVIAGDTLWDISVRSYGDGYKWVELAKVNNLKNPDIIHPGNEFVIPR